MIVYILKFILCSGVLFGAYHFLLKQEKTLKFNRFFLLSILGLSLILPKLVTKIQYVEPEPVIVSIPLTQSATPIDSAESIVQQEASGFDISQSDLLWIVFALFSLFFIIRFIHNLTLIAKLRQGGKLVNMQDLTFCLRSDINSSFTFMGTIYTNKERFEAQLLPQEIIEHEAVHAKQWHSIDIIAMELFQCLLWFNPMVYLIKSAIKLNHEYLADAAVCEQTDEISKYQKTLIQYVYNSKQQPVMASQLTYGQTKNRLNMMVKNLRMRDAALRILVTLLVVSVSAWGFGETKLVAQNSSPDNTQAKLELEEKALFEKRKKAKEETKVKFLDKEGNEVEKSYKDLSDSELQWIKNEKSSAMILIPKEEKNPPSAEKLQDFLNEEKYGVWVDGQSVSNEALKDFKSSDFHHYKVSRLLANSKNYGKHTYQVDLVTNDAFDDNDRWIQYKDVLQEVKPPKSQKQNIPPPPPPRMVNLNDYSEVKYIQVNGKEVRAIYGELSEEEKEHFKSKLAKGQIFLPPPPPAQITNEMLQKYSNGEYTVWVDGKEIKPNALAKYSPNDFYIYKKQLTIDPNSKSRSISGIEFITREKWESTEWSKGDWILFDDDFLPEKKELEEVPSKKVKAPVKNDQDDYGILKDQTLVQFKNNGSTVQKTFGSLSKAEKQVYFSQNSDAQVFNVVEKTATMSDTEWKALNEEDKFGIWMNGDKIANSQLKDFKPSDIYKYQVRKMHPSMKNLGDFDYQYFALSNDFVTNKYEKIDGDYGAWYSYQQLHQLNAEVSQMAAKKN